MDLLAAVVDSAVGFFIFEVGGAAPEVHPVEGGEGEAEALVPRVVAGAIVGDDVAVEILERVEVGTRAEERVGLRTVVVVEDVFLSDGYAEDGVVDVMCCDELHRSEW